jgi:phosphoribosylaminoimidazole-succinocarboxamide synthase
MLEAALWALPLDFEALPLLIEGESKVLRQWTDGVVVTRLKPTVYSYSMNRSGAVPGTDDSRLRFTATLFRRMAALPPQAGIRLQNAFLAARDTPAGPLLIERRVPTCNLEVRVKRYHIGSPLHRYRYTEQYPSLQAGGPIGRWSRFDQPLVCFDWRHPLTDEAGTRLADEPISDDYAAVWMENVPHAKELARQTFLWMESLFEAGGLRLVDICFFVDRTGRLIYGEVSPDCMRVRRLGEDLDSAAPGAKDIWRAGGSPEALLANYEDIYRRVFG